ncbi:MAG: tetratricopeptide repeat protein [Verrucomicrobiota bacterium]
MSSSLQRAQHLRECHRHEEAVALLHQHLAHEPDDAEAYVELAFNHLQMPGQRVLANDYILKAIGILPDIGHIHALHARILNQLDRFKEGITAAERAIALDPENGFCWVSKGEALIGLSEWKDAEKALIHSLELDPDGETASNLLAIALRMQNRLDESNDETKRRLARDPENPLSLANAGWSALQSGKIEQAENLFRDSLRIDPECEYARDGLKESFRARSAFYRLFLRWVFFMQRFNEKNQMWIMIGIVVGFRFLRKAVQEINPALLPPLFVVFYVFIFGTWLSSGIANLMILRDKSARLSLDRSEKLDGLVVGGGFMLGLILGIFGLTFRQDVMILLGAMLMIAAIPSSMCFTNGSFKGRIVFGIITILVYITGIIGILGFTKIENSSLVEHGIVAIGGPILIAFLSTWIAMLPSLKKSDTEH